MNGVGDNCVSLSLIMDMRNRNYDIAVVSHVKITRVYPEPLMARTNVLNKCTYINSAAMKIRKINKQLNKKINKILL